MVLSMEVSFNFVDDRPNREESLHIKSTKMEPPWSKLEATMVNGVSHPPTLLSSTPPPPLTQPTLSLHTTQTQPTHSLPTPTDHRPLIVSVYCRCLLKPRHFCNSSRRRSTLLLVAVLLPAVLLKQHRFYRSARRVTSDSSEPPLFFTFFRCRAAYRLRVTAAFR
ncbi:hypothetical protein PIB30_046198 [Stylosanthes scabra]|uniref:Uncharacterized protein n=1 Tax=Stylosanthes scabra TaxID=79078 RepID=A0ABU6ZF58_9FABA|nr:hypothetical protein [Stylosanthes scabra]